MVNKNKNFLKSVEVAASIGRQLGLGVMIVGAMLSMAELAEKESHALLAQVQLQPVYVSIETHFGEQQLQGRRSGGREEIRHSTATYGPPQLSQPISGPV